jgi:pilus assembly protein Flp/PilA
VVTTLFQSLYTLSFITGERVSGRMAALKEERGASAVEYALLIGVLAAAIIGALALFGPRLAALIQNIDLNGNAAGNG